MLIHEYVINRYSCFILLSVDIDECALREKYPDKQKDYPCSSDGICVNKPGGYDCPCKHGMRGDGKAGTCTEQFPLRAKIAVGKRVQTSITSFSYEECDSNIIVFKMVIQRVPLNHPSGYLLALSLGVGPG